MRTSQKSAARQTNSESSSLARLHDAMIVQAIEENPLDAEQVAMFETFERERWPHEKRRAHLMALSLRTPAEAPD